jgi:hypothetical protein
MRGTAKASMHEKAINDRIKTEKEVMCSLIIYVDGKKGIQ